MYMNELTYIDGRYKTSPEAISFWAKRFPSLTFYPRFVAIVFRASAKAKRAQYSSSEWAKSSLAVLRALEGSGVSVEITGVQHIVEEEGPYVFIANHMSTLETTVLASVIQPLKEVTFIVKKSLLEYPVFRHVMRSRDPIALTRTNPREDLKAVLQGGTERLKNGISIVVFPQTTRTTSFDPAQFNSIGIKLAKKAGVPVIPIALKSDAWGNGTYLKDFGKIDPSKEVYLHFGNAIRIKGKGTEEHQHIIEFIIRKLHEWETKESA